MTFNLALMGHPYTAAVTKIPAAALNYICVSLNNAADLQNGGTFTLLSQLVIQGAGTKFDFGAAPGLEIAGVFGARVLNGSTLQVNSGGFLTLAATSTTTFTATSLITGSAKVTLTIENLSVITYASGSQVDFQAGSDLLLSGDVLIAGSCGVSSTGDITFLNGAELNLHSGAVMTADSGSTTTLAGTTNVSSTGTLTVQSSGNLNVANGANETIQSGGTLTVAAGATLTLGVGVIPTHAARTFTRPCRPMAHFNPTHFTPPWFQTVASATGFTDNTSSTNSSAVLAFDIDVPDAATITSYQVFIDPPAGHGASPPTNMPRIELWEMSANTMTMLSSQTDTTATTAAYEARHVITKSGVSHLLDRITKSYQLLVYPERDTGAASPAVTGGSYEIPLVTFTRTKLGEE